jgi:hypothetical protein
MTSAIGAEGVAKSQLGIASVLLIGVLVTAYGYFHPSKIALYAGLFLTAGAVLIGVVRVVTRDHGGAPGA